MSLEAVDKWGNLVFAKTTSPTHLQLGVVVTLENLDEARCDTRIDDKLGPVHLQIR